MISAGAPPALCIMYTISPSIQALEHWHPLKRVPSTQLRAAKLRYLTHRHLQHMYDGQMACVSSLTCAHWLAAAPAELHKGDLPGLHLLVQQCI